MLREEIAKHLKKTIGEEEIILQSPEIKEHGDYASNIALIQAKKGESSRELAEKIKSKLSKDILLSKYISKFEVAGPGFINLFISENTLFKELEKIIKEKDIYGKSKKFKGNRIMVEFAHPNTHKEFHIGHMRTLILGETLARMYGFAGAKVFRANYQGDIGPHVAKAIWGVREILKRKKISWSDAEKYSFEEKARLLGEGYIEGIKKYKEKESEINDLNNALYKKDKGTLEDYKKTRKWSLEYFESIYNKFGTKFDKLYFESEVEKPGKELVLNKLSKIFDKSEGAIIFDGEKYGLHKRVFITKDGNATYEGKEMGLIPMQFADFEFDRNIHVVANEQIGYFKVVFMAAELINNKLKGRLYHLPMGMVNLVGRKMSSRTGEIISANQLLASVAENLENLVGKDINTKQKKKISEKTSMAAVRYSMLRVNPTADVVFDVKKSVNFNGESGPYLQYTYARCKSVLRKAKKSPQIIQKSEVNEYELVLMRHFIHFPEVIVDASKNYSPNLICKYMFDLAQKYNNFYNENKIIGDENENLRLLLTKATAQILKNGLNLLGVEVLEQM